MIEERVKEWTQQWQAEGYQLGVAEGRREGAEQARREGAEEGRREGFAKALESLLALKFGPSTAACSDSLATASFEQLEIWSQRILTAESLEQVFEDP